MLGKVRFLEKLMVGNFNFLGKGGCFSHLHKYFCSSNAKECSLPGGLCYILCAFSSPKRTPKPELFCALWPKIGRNTWGDVKGCLWNFITPESGSQRVHKKERVKRRFGGN